MFSMGTLKTSEAAALLHAGVRDGAGAHERREAQA
jgi:hypothetical protein